MAGGPANFTGLGRDVLDWIARELADPIVSRQVQAVIPIERKYTGAGSFTELRVQDGEVPRTTLHISPVDPSIVSPELSHGGGCVLYFENGLLATLELFAYVGAFPRDLREWTLAPVGQTK